MESDQKFSFQMCAKELLVWIAKYKSYSLNVFMFLDILLKTIQYATLVRVSLFTCKKYTLVIFKMYILLIDSCFAKVLMASGRDFLVIFAKY